MTCHICEKESKYLGDNDAIIQSRCCSVECFRLYLENMKEDNDRLEILTKMVREDIVPARLRDLVSQDVLHIAAKIAAEIIVEYL